MNITNLNISGFENIYDYLYRINNDEIIERFKIIVNEYFNIINKLLEVDIDDLSDEDFYKLLTKFYDINLDSDDYLEILSQYNDKKYVNYGIIPTNMTFYDIVSEGHGKNFSWWEEELQACYHVAYSDNFKIDMDRLYTKDEIKELVSNKEIVILKEEDIPLTYNDNFTYDKYEFIPSLNIDISYYSNNMSQFLINNFNLFGKILRKNFTNKKILSDIKKSMYVFKKEIEEVILYLKSDKLINSQVGIACENWFDSYLNTNQYKMIMKNLNK